MVRDRSRESRLFGKIARRLEQCGTGRMIDRKSKKTAMYKLSKMQTMQVIASVCQKYGCEIRKVDLEKRILDLQGPEDAQERCKQELQVLLD